MTTMTIRYRSWAIAVALFLGLALIGSGSTAAASSTGAITYAVTIQNLTKGQPFSPPVAATHQTGFHMFQTGQLASDALAAIAQDGDPMPMFQLVSGAAQVTDRFNIGHPMTPQGTQKMPMGMTVTDTATFAITANPGDRFSLATMLTCTNDGFLGLDGVALPDQGSLSYELKSYDAGREQNTEKAADMVDSCSALGPVMLPGDPGGNRDKEVATTPAQLIGPHPAIKGTGDLTVAMHGWTDPVARVTIARQGAAMPGLPNTGDGGAQRHSQAPILPLAALGLVALLGTGLALGRGRRVRR
jgi:hypothetical protein